MRCAKCGRFLPGHGPKWALACQCGDTSTPSKGWMDAVGLKDGPDGLTTAEERAQIAKEKAHPCPTCPKGDSVARAFGDCQDGCALMAAWLLLVPMAAMVAAIREDKVVGRGSCSRIAECLDDKDLVKELAGQGITTVAGALKWAREDEGLFLEEGLNQRWGEDRQDGGTKTTRRI